MNELISGKEALIALANGEEVHYRNGNGIWCVVENHMDLSNFLDDSIHNWVSFRLKPRTITINGIEVPAPFETKDGDKFYYLSSEDECGYDYKSFVDGYSSFDGNKTQFGAWRTEADIKQVVAALRSVFNVNK